MIYKTHLKPINHDISSYTVIMTSKYGDNVYTGCVKWFNRNGWGFLTITNEGHADEDIFVRWDNLACDGYKYLVQGEYVEFTIEHKPDAQEGREYQATNVGGVNGGKLMCETRHMQKVSAAKHRTDTNPVGRPPQPQVRVQRQVPVPVPVAGHQWVLVPQVQQQQQRPHRPQQQRRN
jgi:cold shock CspA family protein